ncbi:hypothetical protein [Rathayibacter festucae]|uniref:hypothetical protein n=1 Tax=Rathayibacter festucae TaxID=110937 RepID=UPI002A6A0419|nr:hypothetical protein [Rathayibacter festucae]MDY0914489.1 hypothetical protein [Rathayibacter festucae]
MSTNIEVSRHRAGLLTERVKRPKVPVRSSFIVSSDPNVPPPLTRLLRGGRGGEVKLKLLLSMLWIAVADPYDVTQPARVWAELLGLDEPETKGAARVNAAVRRLVEGGFLRAEARKGQPSRLILCEETGRGAPYTHPGSHWEVRKDLKKKSAAGPRYTQIPSTLWTNGWVAVLSGPATAMFLILLEQTRGKNYEELWFSPSVATARYGLSEVTRRKGVEELEELGLIYVDRKPVGKGSLSMIRRRNAYTIEMRRLDQKPEEARVMREFDFAKLLSFPQTPDQDPRATKTEM